MLAQAEHDTDASAVLLTTSRTLADAVAKELAVQLETLSTADVARTALKKNSAIILVDSLDQAVEISNRFAPEHLSIPAAALLKHVQNAGSVFIGPTSPEAAGDYASGPNHVLPTSGAARQRGGLSAADFVKVISTQEISPAALAGLTPAITTLARAEGLEAHARSVEVRVTVANALRPRKAVLDMAPYSPPTGGRADKLRLDFNENTVGCSPHVLKRIREQLTEAGLAVYPEYGAAKHDLAEFLGCTPDEFTLSNGTDEAIQVLINTYIDDGDEVLLLRPSYAMYRFYAEVAGASVRELDYRPGTLDFPLEELLDAIGPQTRAILIANPNNPTGSATDLTGIIKILNRATNAAVLIDEAYYEFYGITALPLVRDYPNLFVSRTFSKAYGMAAMRVGALISQAVNVAYLHKAQSPYSVNAVAALALRAAIEDKHYVTQFVNEVLAARDEVYKGFDRLGIPYLPSNANFVLFHCGPRAIDIRDRLRDMGVLVRDRSYELAGYVRVTVGTRQQVARFLTALEQIW